MKEMNILLAAGAALMTSCGVAAEKLGDGFAPLEWIESTGGQYIDTGVDAGAHTTIDMSFGHCVYGNGSTLFGKDGWDPQGFLFLLQQGKFRFFGAKGKEPGRRGTWSRRTIRKIATTASRSARTIRRVCSARTAGNYAHSRPTAPLPRTTRCGSLRAIAHAPRSGSFVSTR